MSFFLKKKSRSTAFKIILYNVIKFVFFFLYLKNVLPAISAYFDGIFGVIVVTMWVNDRKFALIDSKFHPTRREVAGGIDEKKKIGGVLEKAQIHQAILYASSTFILAFSDFNEII